MKLLLLFAMALATSGVAGQNALQATMTGQPLIYTDQGKPKGCGVRIVGIVEPAPGQREFKAFDISANIYKGGQAIAKVIGESQQVGDINPANARRLKLHGSWFRVEGAEPVSPAPGSFRASSSDAGAFLFQPQPEATVDFILGALQGRPLQVAVRWQEGIDAIYTGNVTLSAEQRRQVASCIVETLQF